MQVGVTSALTTKRGQAMDVSGISSLATAMTQAQTADAVQLAVLKKAMDIQAQGAMQLIQAASQATSNNPPHLGNQVNTFA
jgi:hypothetical protein